MNEDQPQPARAKRQNTGFTLIELLIVIAILGILSVVVVLSVNGITNRGQGSSCSADLKTQQIAAESYRAQNGAYPTTQAAAQHVPQRAVDPLRPTARHGHAVHPGTGVATLVTTGHTCLSRAPIRTPAPDLTN